MQIRILNGADVRKLLPMEACIPLMRTAMKMVADGTTQQPIRQALRQPDGKGLISMMPGWTAEPPVLGIKLVTVFPGNFGTEFGSHQGFVLLFDTTNGAPVAVLDGREITAIRTAAATAVATDALARKSAKSLAIFGYGEQASVHLEALTQIRKFERVFVWGRDAKKVEEFCAEHKGHVSPTLVPVSSPEEAVKQADVLCTVTAAPTPYLKGEWLRSGQHLSVVGSSVPTTAEIDVETVARSRVFVDFMDSALALAGDLRNALESGRVERSHFIGSVGDVLSGIVSGRQSDDEITLFKSLGMICEDLVSAQYIVSQAIAKDVGQTVTW